MTPLDRGLAYGDGVFRTFPVRRGIVHCWERHYQRLRDDCSALNIVCPPSDDLLADIGNLCDAADDVAIKIIVTRGEGVRGYAVPAPAQPTRMVIKSPMPIYPEQHFAEGVRLQLCQLRLAMQPRLAGIKHLNRLENVLARMEWNDAQIADGVLLDTEGHVIECTMSNLFARHGGVLVTPDLSRCGVAGVTRQRIIEFVPELGYEISIGDFNVEALLSADEVMICNSLYGAWQVRSLNATAWPAGELAARVRSRLEQEDAPVA